MDAQFGVVSVAECLAAQGEEAVFFLYPSELGSGVAGICSYAAINANSKNQYNALSFSSCSYRKRCSPRDIILTATACRCAGEKSFWPMY